MIGAGNLATNVAHALCGAGFQIVQVYSRTPASAMTLAQSVGADYTTCFDSLVNDADLYIVALKDTAFVEHIADICKGKSERSLWVHTAGSLPMDIFKGVVARYGVFYPMQTFSKQHIIDFRDIPFFIEASNDDDKEMLLQLARAISNKVYEADSQQRKSLHLAAVFTCNFSNHMYAMAAHLLEKYNLPFEVMLPLIDETARKVHHLAPLAAQTGPAIRYDEQVIGKHLEMLNDEPALQELYQLISRNIHEFSKR